ncbi:MAG: hypothetical protein O2821_06480 [Chloroflexi bacterium]|nr:hypothetical protein [Chloroflexota bacterium]MDA1228705.1 hypothetical protein [Chloroflexota bacterium]
MPELSKEQILEMAKMAGLAPDDRRAEVIAARLGAVLQALSEVPDESLVDYPPALTFAPKADSTADKGVQSSE